LVTPLIPSIGQEPGSSSSPPTVHVKGHGCLKPGSVSGCVVLNDYKAHRKYNVFFMGDKPDMNTGISFEGLGYSHPDPHCKQGQKVQVTEWKPLQGECPQNRYTASGAGWSQLETTSIYSRPHLIDLCYASLLGRLLGQPKRRFRLMASPPRRNAPEAASGDASG
jgi:hypothetical protein